MTDWRSDPAIRAIDEAIRPIIGDGAGIYTSPVADGEGSAITVTTTMRLSDDQYHAVHRGIVSAVAALHAPHARRGRRMPLTSIVIRDGGRPA